MDWIRFRAAIIRFGWTVIFPLLGTGVTYLIANPETLEEFGVTNGAIGLVIGAILYGLKKLFWPDTTL